MTPQGEDQRVSDTFKQVAGHLKNMSQHRITKILKRGHLRTRLL